MDPLTIAMLGGMGMNFLGGLFGSKEQSDSDKANLAFQMQRQAMMTDYFNRMVTPGMNPFAQAMLNFTRQGLPGAVNGFNPMSQYGQPTQPSTPGGINLSDWNGIIPSNPAYSASPGGSSSFGGQAPNQSQYDPSVSGPGQIPGYGGSTSFAYANAFPGIDFQSLDPGTTFRDLVNKGLISEDQVYNQFGRPNPNDPGAQQDSAEWVKWMSEHGRPGMTIDDFFAQVGPMGSNAMGLIADDPAQFQEWMSGLPSTDIYGGQGAPNPQYFDPTQQTGWGQGGQGGGGYGQNSQMYQYQNPGAFTYAPMTNVAATGTQAQNAGQDALMQMMRKNLQPSQDPNLDLNLQQLGQGQSQYNLTDLFKSIDDSAALELDDQLAQLHGSAGSLGQRYGSAMQNSEAKLRANFLTNKNAQKQQLGFGAFEAAQGRRQPALNLAGGLLGQRDQFNLGALGTQGGLAQGLAGLGQGMAGLNLQAALANQQAFNQGGQFNAGQRTMADQFGAQQGNIYNNLMLQALSQAGGLQANQQSQNASLFGILGGVGVPQTQPGQWGSAIQDAGSMLAMPWLYNQFMK
jgi:hypothetical protein